LLEGFEPSLHRSGCFVELVCYIAFFNFMEDVIKQIIVIRKDLNMRKGKLVAQGSHASIAFLTRRMRDKVPVTEVQEKWINGKFTKICVYVNSEAELLEIENRAIEAKLEVSLITDSGLTEFNGVPTRTCLAIGPDYSSKIDKITGHLSLL
jgi:PTH2 family peptidyl-tRNA hydrolase